MPFVTSSFLLLPWPAWPAVGPLCIWRMALGETTLPATHVEGGAELASIWLNAFLTGQGAHSNGFGLWRQLAGKSWLGEGWK